MNIQIIKQGVSSAIIALLAGPLMAAENYPFPQNIDYHGINPNNETTTAQNTAVANFYDYWKSKYLKQAASGGYYVHGADTDGRGKGTSESHGYGMLLTVLMAGYDPSSKQEFDGLYQFFDSHRSNINNELMGWFIDSQESGTGTYSSATDGDMDIAYALLLADMQWGSSGPINYKAEAIDMINKGLRVGDYHGSSRRLMLGDWESKQNTTRSSDWMPGHLRAYTDATNDGEWLMAIDEIFTMVGQLNNLNNNTGLMPDFVTGSSAVPDHHNDNGTGEQNPGDYYYNAARTPMRLAMDYIHNNNVMAKNASDILTVWTKQQVGTAYNFNNYFSGYTVTGTVLPGSNYSSTVFIAPIVVAASVDAANQDFVNAGWNFIKNTKENYFEDSVNLLSMLALTGNWWAPNQVGEPGNGIPKADPKSSVTQQNTTAVITLSGTDTDGTIVSYAIDSIPQHGVVSLQGNTASYVPTNDYIGTDSFTYTVTDNDNKVSLPAQVSLTIEDTVVTPTLKCEVTESVWNSGFTADIKVTNISPVAISQWQVAITLGAGDQFDYGWSAEFNTSGNPVVASNLWWNKHLEPGQSTYFGFLGVHNGNHSATACNNNL